MKEKVYTLDLLGEMNIYFTDKKARDRAKQEFESMVIEC